MAQVYEDRAGTIWAATLGAVSRGAALARAIVALGDVLALDTVAKGVETDAQAEALRAMGCAYAREYLFARPTDEAGLVALLAAE